MDTTTPLWLAAAALAIGALVRMLKSDTLNALLTRLKLPPIPKAALPWVSLGLGVAGGVVASLQAHDPWRVALAKAFEGLLSGGLAVAGHEGIVEGLRAGRELPARDPVPSFPPPIDPTIDP